VIVDAGKGPFSAKLIGGNDPYRSIGTSVDHGGVNACKVIVVIALSGYQRAVGSSGKIIHSCFLDPVDVRSATNAIKRPGPSGGTCLPNNRGLRSH
jgi:hypothetical protein